MKKKLLIFTYFCEYNGVEKSVLNFLKNLNPDDFEIDLLILGNNSVLLKDVPHFVNTIQFPLSDYMRDVVILHPRAMINKLRSKKQYFSIVRYVISTTFNCLLHGFNRHAVCRTPAKKYKTDKKYDLAFDFYGHNLFGTYFISKNIISDKKATWLHSPLFLDDKLKNFEHIYKNYDRVYSVSYECCDKFKEIFPNLGNKLEIFRNLIDVNDIVEKGKAPIQFVKNTLFFSTVGRLHAVKGYDTAVQAAKLLKEKGYKFKWFFVGSGNSDASLKNMVQQNNLQDYIVFTGFCENPYKYISKSDIYIQPSRYEGYCTTLIEARILKVPPIASDIIASKEQIIDGENGLLFKTNDAKDLCEKIEILIQNTEQKQKILENETADLSYKSELKKIYQLLENH